MMKRDRRNRKKRRDRSGVKREILIDKELYTQLEDLALDSGVTVDKLAEVFIFSGISHLSLFAALLEGEDPIRELIEGVAESDEDRDKM